MHVGGAEIDKYRKNSLSVGRIALFSIKMSQLDKFTYPCHCFMLRSEIIELEILLFSRIIFVDRMENRNKN